jgi:asparagine synthase (glutamine-hydrolysing)
VGEWFRAQSLDWLRRALASSELVGQLFQPHVVDGMVEQHRDGKANFTRELRALAALALWDAQRGES